MAALGSLVVSLEANMAKFSADMGKAAYQTEQAMQRMESSSIAAKDALVDLAKGAIAGLSVGALASMVQSAMNAADELGKMAEKTGVAATQMAGLNLAAGMAGSSAEGMTDSLTKLNRSIAEAAGGDKATSAAFSAMGINILDAAGKAKTADVVFKEMADKFADYANGPEKVALSMAVLGKSGADMINLLNGGSAAIQELTDYSEKYSGVTDELIQRSTVFNDTMSLLQVQQSSLGNVMAAEVLPILQAIANETLHAAENSDKFSIAGAGVRVVLQTLTVLAAEVAFVFARVGNTIGGTAAQLDRLAHLDFKGVGAINDMIKADDAQARKDHDAFLSSIMNPASLPQTAGGTAPPKPNAPRLPGTSPAGAGAKAKDPDADFKHYLKQLNNQIQKTQELTVYEKLLADIRAGTLTVDASQEARLTGIAQEIDATKEAVRISTERQALRKKDEQDSINAIREIEAEKAREAKANAANVEQIGLSLMNEADLEVRAYGLRMQELQKFHDEKAENVRLANELMEAETLRHEQTKADLQASYNLQALSMAGNSADQLYSLMQKAGMEQTALGKAVFLAGKALAIAEIIINTEVAAAKATAMFPVYGVAIATGIRVAGYASAGLVAGMAIAEVSGAREKGGPVWGGGAFLVGEKGPEIFQPSGHGTIIPNSALGGGSSGAITIVNNTSAKIEKVTEQRMSNGERALIIEEAVAATAAQFGDPNSKTSRAFSRNYATQRSR